jgi:dienelactone hydrolase
MLVWMHGRTARKELDPGRYLRLMRSGIAVCAVDLPGHGDRMDEALHGSNRVLDIVLQMRNELDGVTLGAIEALGVDSSRVALGGMSAGGMAAIARLCSAHRFRSAMLQATTGDWTCLEAWTAMHAQSQGAIVELNPIAHLDNWRPLPVLAVHSETDAWISWPHQQRFLQAVAARGETGLVQVQRFKETGAPFEHVGFGRYAAQVKEDERAFLVETLINI